jgi:signal transduction histidine kinase
MFGPLENSDLDVELDAEAWRRVRVEQFEPLFQYPSRNFGHVINAGLISAILWGEISNTIILVWLGATVVVSLARIALSMAYKRRRPAPAEIDRWIRWFFIGMVFSASLWGVSSCVVWLHPDLSYHAMIVFPIGGTAAAAAIMTYAHLPSLQAFMLFSVIPLAINLALKGEGVYLAMGAMVSAFIVFALGHAYGANRLFIRSLVLREQNRVLVADISAARDSLEERVKERTAELDLANNTLRAEMTAHEETEARLRQAQKMEAVGQLTGGIAHDFNNMLSVIQGNLELLVRRKIDDQDLSQKMDAMMRASKHGAQLTRQLLAFSRRQTLHPQTVEVNHLLSSMIGLLQTTIGEVIDVRFVPDDGICEAHVDPGQLESAILNLAINSRDAMPEGGVLTIATASGEYKFPTVPQSDDGEEENDSPAEGQFALIAVSDTGTGISAEILDKVWEPFFTTKGVGEGSGLGLSMVYGFVRQSGGHLEIDSTEGEGTTVRLYLLTKGPEKLRNFREEKISDTMASKQDASAAN